MDINSPEAYETPFAKPLLSLPSADLHSALAIVFLFVVGAWLIYTAVAAYHWFRYSHRSWLAVPAVGAHVFISGALILYIASGVI